MNDTYLRLIIQALLPPVLSVTVFLLDKKTPFGKWNDKVKQLIIGVLFGLLAVWNTEWGFGERNDPVSCRDAVILTAGLMFGAPAGVIAGIIGCGELWLVTAIKGTTFTWLSGGLAALLAGIYAGLLRKYMFEDKRPGWLISLVIGIVSEIFYFILVFTTRLNYAVKAMEIVKYSTLPALGANGISVLLSGMFLSAHSGRKSAYKKQENAHISQTVQRWLLVTVLMAFTATTLLVSTLQSKIATKQTDTLLTTATQDVAADIHDVSDNNMLDVTYAVAEDVRNGMPLYQVKHKHSVTEISVVNNEGIITDSTEERFLNYDMASGEQSAEFLCLLGNNRSFVQECQIISYDGVTMRKYAGVKTATGFIQVGYDASRFQQDIDESVVDLTKNRHVGSTGYILILDNNYSPVSAPEGVIVSTEDVDRALENLPEENVTFQLEISGSMAYCSYLRAEGYTIVAILPRTEALQVRNIALYVNTFLEILVFSVLFTLIYILIKKIIVDRMKEVNQSLAKIADGNLEEAVNVRSNEEFAVLSDDINTTVDTLKHYIAEASARIDKELEFAKSIQSSVLPNVFPAFPKRKDFDIYAMMDPAKEVGGDFYDFYLTRENNLHLLVADVSGKGIPAAMFMMRAKTQLKSLTEAELPLSEVFTQGNEALCEGNDAGMFVTAWQGSIDLTTGTVQYVNAGHNPPLVRHQDGQFEFLRSKPGFVLAGMDGIQYKAQTLQLTPGDILFLYTDGVTEATNGAQELYGNDRLLQTLNRVTFTDMQSLCNCVKQDVDAFVGEAPQFDDITMAALCYVGSAPVPSITCEQAKLEDIPQVTEFVCDELDKLQCPAKIKVQFSIAVDEIYSNIVRYGYAGEKGFIRVEVFRKEDPAAIYLRFTDEGMPYNPLKKEDPNVSLSAEERTIGGLGIFMVKKTMDDMKYEYENERNILTIQKLL